MFEIMSHDKAYFLGFFSADGSNEGRSISIQLQERDDYILQDFQNFFESEGYYANFQSGNRVIECKDGLHYYSRLRISSSNLCKELSSIGLHPNKTYNIRMPLIEDRYMPDYLRGLIDGDGNLYERRKYLQIEIISASKVFIEDVADWIIQNTSIRSKSINKHGSVFRIQFYGNESKELCDLIYNTPSSLYLIRKRNIYDNYRFIPSSRYWTEDQIEYLKDQFIPNVKGLGEQIALHLGKSKSSVYKKIWELGLVNKG